MKYLAFMLILAIGGGGAWFTHKSQNAGDDTKLERHGTLTIFDFCGDTISTSDGDFKLGSMTILYNADGTIAGYPTNDPSLLGRGSYDFVRHGDVVVSLRICGGEQYADSQAR